MVARAVPFLALYLAQIINAFLTSGNTSLLCFLSKVLKKIVHDQIQEYLVANEILHPRKAGSRQHNSTETALSRLTEDIRSNIDSQKIKVMREMWFLRAVLCWISSYITGRRQKVISKSEGESDWLYGKISHTFNVVDATFDLFVLWTPFNRSNWIKSKIVFPKK